MSCDFFGENSCFNDVKLSTLWRKLRKLFAFPGFWYIGFAKVGKATESSSNRDLPWWKRTKHLRQIWNMGILQRKNHIASETKISTQKTPAGHSPTCHKARCSGVWHVAVVFAGLVHHCDIHVCGCANKFSVNCCRMIGTDNNNLLRMGTAAWLKRYHIIRYYMVMYIDKIHIIFNRNQRQR